MHAGSTCAAHVLPAPREQGGEAGEGAKSCLFVGRMQSAACCRSQSAGQEAGEDPYKTSCRGAMVMLAKAEFPDSSLPNSPWSKTAGKDLLLICSPKPFIDSFITYMAGRALHGARDICSWLVCIGIQQSVAHALGVQHPQRLAANCAVRWTYCVH